MSRNSRLLSVLLAISGIMPIAAQAAPLPTATTLTISAPQVAWHTPVTLTAQVTAGGAPIPAGTVTFCNTSGLYARCEDSAIVGKAQLTGISAQISFIPSIGAHQYTAIFNGTSTAAPSTSAAQSLTVTGLYPTTTSIAASGNPGGYQLTATVVGFANHPPLLSGTVSFEDTSNNNFVLGTGSLGAPSFAEMFAQAPGSPITAGNPNQPAAGATADFNGDSKPDLAIMASVSNAVFIYLGNGDGTFRAGQIVLGVGNTPCILDNQASNCSMTTGDFDHNGTADLAITSGSDNTVIILLGHGDGTFTPATGSPITVGHLPDAVRTGDFNNDGLLDLAVANSEDNTVTILLGNGNGTFTPSAGSPVPTGGYPLYLTVADFRGTGASDIAVSNESDSTVTVLLSNGDGTFTEAPGSPILNINYNPAQIVAADFNSDGIPDLAVANFTAVPPSTVGNVVVLLGKGDGSFNPAPGSPIPVGVDPLALVAADFNQDGNIDLGVDNYGLITQPQTQTLTLLLGDGKGNFASAGTTQLGDSPNDLVPADYNEDGTIDLAIPNIADFDTTILLNEFTQTATATASNITIAGVGTHYVDAVYGGNTYFAPSTSNTIPLQGSQVNTSLTLTANPNEQMLTMPVTFTAQLASLSNEPPFASPTGTVSFFDVSLGNKLLGTAAMGANFQAIFTLDTSSIGPGVHVISASYSGDKTFLPSNSNQISEQVDDLGISRVGNNNTNILPGTTVIYTLQLTPYVATKFLYTVNFSTSGLPAGAGATFSPVTLAAGGSAAKVTMTVTTAASALNLPPSPFGRLPLALGLLLPLFASKEVRRRLRNIPPLLGAVLLAVLSLSAVAGLSGCSGAGLFAAKKVPYTITVTATEGTRQVSTTVPLAIQ